MDVINIKDLVKDYGNGKGIFNISLNVKKGEVFGFLGPNGAGKTTTIRHLLGFSKPQSGVVEILGLNCWKDAKQIQNHIGYLPGEISFPNNMTGEQFIQFIADMRGLKDMNRAKELIKLFNLDTSSQLKRMSKGTKQKIGIVCAFMHNPKVIILDEPTSGLDPLMQANFIKLVKQEKALGKTILMSSHIFGEIEETADRIGIIKNGKIIAISNPDDIKYSSEKIYEIKFTTKQDFIDFTEMHFEIINKQASQNQVTVKINGKEINQLIQSLSTKDVEYFSEIKHTLEAYFMNYYEGEISNAI